MKANEELIQVLRSLITKLEAEQEKPPEEVHASSIQLARFIQLPLFERVTGYSQKAIRRKIEEGHWLEGKQFRRAPDGHILVDLEAYYRWVEEKNFSKKAS